MTVLLAVAPALRSESHWGDPVVLASLAVAFGTILLALLTYRLSRATRQAAGETAKEAAATVELASAAKKQLEAAQEQIRLTGASLVATERELDLSRESLDASVQPLLVNTAVERGADGESLLFSDAEGWVSALPHQALVFLDRQGFLQATMTFYNMGRGAAVVLATSILSGPGDSWPGDFDKTFVGPSDTARVKFSVPRDRFELTNLIAGIESGAATMRIAYSDVSGRQQFWSDALLYIEGTPERCRVRQLAVWRVGEPGPFITSGPIAS